MKEYIHCERISDIITLWFEKRKKEDIEESFDILFLVKEMKESIKREKHIFDVSKNKSLYELQEGTQYLVCAKIKTNILTQTFYNNHWKILSNLDEIKEFIKDNDDYYIFELSDDVYNEFIKEFTEKKEKEEEHRMRLVRFDGNIIITDPCYLVRDRDTSNKPAWDEYMSYKSVYDYPDYNEKKSALFDKENKKYQEAYEKWDKENPDDRDVSNGYEHMEKLGFEKEYLVSRTYYGDWSCTTYNTDTKKTIGHFAADSGMVCVMDYEEVLNYNPEFLNFLEMHPDCATIINDFHGTIQFKKTRNGNGIYVKGKGNINFRTKQTGL